MLNIGAVAILSELMSWFIRVFLTMPPFHGIVVLTLLEPQSRSGDKPVKFQVVLSPNGTAVLKGLTLEEKSR